MTEKKTPSFTSEEARRWLVDNPTGDCPVLSCNRDGMRSAMGLLLHLENDHGYVVRRHGPVDTIQAETIQPEVSGNGKNAAAVELGRAGGLKGGPARAAVLSADERSRIATEAAQARWGKGFSRDAGACPGSGTVREDGRLYAVCSSCGREVGAVSMADGRSKVMRHKAEGAAVSQQGQTRERWEPAASPGEVKPAAPRPASEPPSRWERFDKHMRLGARPTVAIYPTGSLNLNHAAYVALGEPVALELLFDRAAKRIGLRVADHRDVSSYLVTHLGKHKLSHSVSAKAFVNALGLLEPVSCHRYDAVFEEGVLVIEPDGGSW